MSGSQSRDDALSLNSMNTRFIVKLLRLNFGMLDKLDNGHIPSLPMVS
jgi:hypothetical protein